MLTRLTPPSSVLIGSAIAILWALSACSHGIDELKAGRDGGADTGVDAGPRVEQGDFCRTYAEIYCNAVPLCCSTATEVPPTCVAEVRDICEAGLIDVFSRSDVGYDPVRAAEMLAEGRDLTLACADMEFLVWATSRDRLYGGFLGTVPGGQPCEPIGLMITQAAVAFLNCADPTQSCRGPRDGKTCQARGAVGADCTYAVECQDGLRCVASGTDIIGRSASCESMGEPVGSHCRLPDECQSLNCTAEGYFSPGVCAGATPDEIYCR